MIVSAVVSGVVVVVERESVVPSVVVMTASVDAVVEARLVASVIVGSGTVMVVGPEVSGSVVIEANAVVVAIAPAVRVSSVATIVVGRPMVTLVVSTVGGWISCGFPPWEAFV